MVILQFNFLVVTVKYLCNGRHRITTTYFLVLVLPRLRFVFAMQLKCSVFIFAIKIHTAFKKIHTKFKLKFTLVSYKTLRMDGSAVPQLCKCKVSEFPWKLANARVSDTDLSYSCKGNKTHVHTLPVVI